MVQRESFRFPDFVCDTCIEAAFDAGFGDLRGRETTAKLIAFKRGRELTDHECEKSSCECTCLREQDRFYMAIDEEEEKEDEDLVV